MVTIQSPVTVYQRTNIVGGGFTSGISAPTDDYIFPAEKKPESNFFLARDIRPGRAFRPLCIMLWGRRGEGKTLGMTAIAAAMRASYIEQGVRYHREKRPWGRRIGSNYHIDFADFNNPMLVDMITDFPDWAGNSLFCIDEMGAYFPNRRSLARPHLNFSTFLQQIRKLGTELIFTTQFPQNMDGQILQQIDLFATPRRVNNGRDLKIMLWDWWGQFTGDFSNKRWPPNPTENPPDYTLTIYDIFKLYGHYPTEEVVAPLWSNQRSNIIERNWGSELEEINKKDQKAAEKAAEERVDRLKARGGFIKTLDALLDSQPDSVSVKAMLNRAKKVDDTIKTMGDLSNYMEDHGWAIHKNRNQVMGERIG